MEGKVALVTGSSSGIGRATAIAFAKSGAFVFLTGRNESELLATMQQCIDSGKPESSFSYFSCDITDEQARLCLIEACISKFHRLDYLVNSAGILHWGLVEACSMVDYDRIMDVNLRSSVDLTRLAIPHLKATKGSIVNVSSVAGLRSFPTATFYCMTKAALDMFTQCLALELAPHGVRVNAVNPAVIITDIHKRIGMSDEEYAAYLKHCNEIHALGRPGTPNEVADVIVFLAGDSASFITGTLMPVSGGRHCMTPR